MRIAIKYLLYVVGALLAITFIYTIIGGYQCFLNLLVELVGGEPYKRDMLETIILTPRRFLVLQILLGFSIAMLAVIFLKYEFIYSKVSTFVSYIKRAFCHIYSDMKTKDAIIVCVIPILTIVFSSLTFPVFCDEAVTGLLVVDQPFYYGMIHYPIPNNHVLHTFILNVIESISPFDLLFTIRISAILVSIFTYFLLFSFVKSYFKENAAIIVTGLSTMLHYSILYSFLSRGYYLQLLFFIICLYAVFNIIRNNQKKDWYIFSISSILGFYTMPSFLYAYIILNLLLLFNMTNLRRVISFGFATGLITLLLYSPIIINDGIGALTSNQFVQPKDRLSVLTALPDFFYNMTGVITGIPAIVVLLLLLGAFIYVIKLKDKWGVYLFVVFLSAPFLLLLLHSIIPFYRTFSYYNVIFILLIVIAFLKYLDKIPRNYLLAGVVCIQIVLFINFYNKRERPSEEFANEVIWERLYHDDISDENVSFYTNYWVGYVLIFERARNNQSAANLIGRDSDLNADELANYNYVILDKKRDITIFRKPEYSDEFINIYINKSN